MAYSNGLPSARNGQAARNALRKAHEARHPRQDSGTSRKSDAYEPFSKMKLAQRATLEKRAGSRKSRYGAHVLSDIELAEVSAVSDPANRHSLILLMKSAGADISKPSTVRAALRKQLAHQSDTMIRKSRSSVAMRFRKTVDISNDSHFFLGWATVSEIDGRPVTDHHGDRISPEEMERAAHSFMLNAREGLCEHDGEPVIDYCVSLPLTDDVKAAFGITVKDDVAGWLLGGYVNDEETWREIKSGNLKGLSIAGSGQRTSIRTGGYR